MVAFIQWFQLLKTGYVGVCMKYYSHFHELDLINLKSFSLLQGGCTYVNVSSILLSDTNIHYF